MKKTGLVRRFCLWGAERFLRRVHRITHRMPIELRSVEKSRVLMIAPHMDDEVISSGGTLALHQQAGSEIAIVFTSNSAGDPTQTGINSETAVRTAEAKACADLLGVKYLKFLNFPDGQLSRQEDALGAALAEIIRAWKPTILFCPFPGDHHRDHQATTAAVAIAVRQAPFTGDVWNYEVWSTLWPNVGVDISSVVETKRRLIDCHVSQVANMPYIDAALGLNRYRGLKVAVAYAEAFYVCPAAEFLQLAETLRMV